MTQHVRTSYRNHRRAVWGAALGLVLAVAAVVIPIASGAPDKTYEMVFPASAVTPAAPTTGNGPLVQNLCTSSSYTSVKLVINNTAKTASLGSADVTFPANVTLTGAAFSGSSPAGASISTSGNVVSLRSLNLPSKTGTVTFSVALTTAAAPAGPLPVNSVVKQSNDFSDSGQNPDANTFSALSPAATPNLKVQTCDATISGRVYHDRDQSGAFAVNGTSPTSDVVKAGWTVTLQRDSGSGYTNVTTTTSAADGTYSVTAQIGGTYRLCVTAPSSDNTTPWGLRAVSGVTLITGCGKIAPPSPAVSKGISVSPLASTGATGQDFVLVPVAAQNFDGGDTSTVGSGSYVVTAAGNSTKAPQDYVQETWTDANGHPYFVFAPINACTSACGDKLYLLELMTGSVKQSDLGPTKQVVLSYDDTEPFQTFVPMPYCLQDPRDGPNLLISGVLPSGATSCIVEAHQTVDGDGTEANAEVDFQFYVYTSHDGSRGFS